MSHKHQILIIATAIGLLGLGAVHVQGQDKYSGLTSDTTALETVNGCVVPGNSWRLFELEQNDIPAAIAYIKPRYDLGVCRTIEKGTRIAIERKILAADSPFPTRGSWYCARPYGDPSCYWVAYYVIKEN